jgi:hypothetical protein
MAGGQRLISWIHPFSTSNVALNMRTCAYGPLMGHQNWAGCDIGLGCTDNPKKINWENFLSGVNGFLNEVEADMRNRGVQAMPCPCIDCVDQKKCPQREIIFHHLVTRGFTKHYTYWNKHGEEGLNELEAGYLNEGEMRHHATDHD